MKWLFDLFKRLFSKPPPALPAASQYDHPDLHDPFPAWTPAFSIKDAIIASARAMAEDQYKKEQDMLSDEKIRQYFIKTFSHLINELRNNDGYDFVLVNRSPTSVPSEVWNIYCDIFYAACDELGIARQGTGYNDYISLKKDQLKTFMATTGAPRIDLDDKVRALLHTGVYR